MGRAIMGAEICLDLHNPTDALPPAQSADQIFAEQFSRNHNCVSIIKSARQRLHPPTILFFRLTPRWKPSELTVSSMAGFAARFRGRSQRMRWRWVRDASDMVFKTRGVSGLKKNAIEHCCRRMNPLL